MNKKIESYFQQDHMESMLGTKIQNLLLSEDSFSNNNSKSQLLNKKIDFLDKVSEFKKIIPEELRDLTLDEMKIIKDFIQSKQDRLLEFIKSVNYGGDTIIYTEWSDIVETKIKKAIHYVNLYQKLLEIIDTTPHGHIINIQGRLSDEFRKSTEIIAKLDPIFNDQDEGNFTKEVYRINHIKNVMTNAIRKLLKFLDIPKEEIASVIQDIENQQHNDNHSNNKEIKTINPREIEQGILYSTLENLPFNIKTIKKIKFFTTNIVSSSKGFKDHNVISDLHIICTDLGLKREQENMLLDTDSDTICVRFPSNNATLIISNNYGIATTIFPTSIISEKELSNNGREKLQIIKNGNPHRYLFDEHNYKNHLSILRKDLNSIIDKNIINDSKPTIISNIVTKEDYSNEKKSSISLPKNASEIIYNKKYTALVTSIDYQKKKINIVLGGTKDNPVRGFIHLIPQLENTQHQDAIEVELEHIYPNNGHMRFRLTYDDY